MLTASQQTVVVYPLSEIADSLRFSGNLEGASEAIREVQTAAEKMPNFDDFPSRLNLQGVLFREGVVLGQDGSVNLGRPEEAEAALERAVELSDALADRDPHDATSRARMAEASGELGKILAHTGPTRLGGMRKRPFARAGGSK